MLRIVFQEYLSHLDEITGRMERLEQEIHLQATESSHAPVIQALQTLRGVTEITATSLVAETGKFSRFRSPRQLMAYTRLVPRECSCSPYASKGLLELLLQTCSKEENSQTSGRETTTGTEYCLEGANKIGGVVLSFCLLRAIFGFALFTDP